MADKGRHDPGVVASVDRLGMSECIVCMITVLSSETGSTAECGLYAYGTNIAGRLSAVVVDLTLCVREVRSVDYLDVGRLRP